MLKTSAAGVTSLPANGSSIAGTRCIAACRKIRRSVFRLFSDAGMSGHYDNGNGQLAGADTVHHNRFTTNAMRPTSGPSHATAKS